MFELEMNSRSFRDCPDWQRLFGAKAHLVNGIEPEPDDDNDDTEQGEQQ